jgi:hypothetical protein
MMHRSTPSVVALLILAALFFALGMLMLPSLKGAEISRGDIAATVAHIRSLALQQKEELIQAQRDYSALNLQLQAAQRAAAQWEAKAEQAGRERDVILYAFAAVVAFYVGTLFGGEVMRNFPAPYSFISCAILYVLAALGAYGIGRLLLSSLARFIP